MTDRRGETWLWESDDFCGVLVMLKSTVDFYARVCDAPEAIHTCLTLYTDDGAALIENWMEDELGYFEMKRLG